MIWFESPEEALRLRETLLGAGYTESRLREVLGRDVLGTPTAEEIAAAAPALRPHPKLRVFVTLFLHGLPDDARAVARALAPMEMETLVKAGLLVPDGAMVRPAIRLAPFGRDRTVLVPCDTRERLFEADGVMGTSSTSVAVALATVGRKGARMLDLCAGSGFQSLLAAEWAGEIVAAEVNPRAVMLGQFAAQLHGAKIGFRQGSGIEPLAGEKFDVIACNPPFVLSPSSTLQYRDGMQGGERVGRKLLREAPALLSDDGLSQAETRPHLGVGGGPWL